MVGAANHHFGEVRVYATSVLPMWHQRRRYRRSLADSMHGFPVANTAAPIVSSGHDAL
jgi:hypothetical protein